MAPGTAVAEPQTASASPRMASRRTHTGASASGPPATADARTGKDSRRRVVAGIPLAGVCVAANDPKAVTAQPVWLLSFPHLAGAGFAPTLAPAPSPADTPARTGRAGQPGWPVDYRDASYGVARPTDCLAAESRHPSSFPMRSGFVSEWNVRSPNQRKAMAIDAPSMIAPAEPHHPRLARLTMVQMPLSTLTCRVPRLCLLPVSKTEAPP